MSRRFIQGTEKALSELMPRPLDEERYPVIKGYRDIPMLAMRLRQHLQAVSQEAVHIG